MSRVIIKNIGAIDYVKLDISKVNIIIGPQSSGKSTIAKIISYCYWVEKRYILDGNYKYDFVDRLKSYHRLSDTYFSASSYIEYESEAIYFYYNFSSSKLVIERINEGEKFINNKISYIPAERNFVSSISNLGRFKESNDNIMEFLYDWYEIKRKYFRKSSLNLLNLGVSYYHRQETDSDNLILQNYNKELLLRNASSGLQSITPLLIFIDYLTNGLANEEYIMSVNEETEWSNFLYKYYPTLCKLHGYHPQKSSLTPDEFLYTTQFDERTSDLFNKIKKRRTSYHYSQLIIEEPEQNLFPKTQQELIYYLFKKINSKNHKVLITTHSPYILSSVNNLIYADILSRRNINIEKIINKEMLIDHKKIAAYYIENGKLISIMDKETGLIRSEMIDSVSDFLNDTFEQLFELDN